MYFYRTELAFQAALRSLKRPESQKSRRRAFLITSIKMRMLIIALHKLTRAVNL